MRQRDQARRSGEPAAFRRPDPPREPAPTQRPSDANRAAGAATLVPAPLRLRCATRPPRRGFPGAPWLSPLAATMPRYVEPAERTGALVEIHEHDEGPHLQPLPQCLAPTTSERASVLAEYREYLPGFDAPNPGDPVMLDGGAIWWLISPDGARPVTAGDTVVFAAGRSGREHCEGARWDAGSGLGAVDPDDPTLEPETRAQARTARDLLLERSNAVT